MKLILKNIAFSFVGILALGALWTLCSSTIAPDLPSPVKTWNECKLYILQPLEKRGEMDQGVGLMAFYSLTRVAKGFFLAILVGTPLGFMLGSSDLFFRM